MSAMCIIAWFAVGTHQRLPDPPLGPMTCLEATRVIKYVLGDARRYPVIRPAEEASVTPDGTRPSVHNDENARNA